MIAFVAVAFGVEGLLQASRSQSRIATLQASLDSLQLRVRADERAAASAAAGERARTSRVARQASGAGRALARVNWQLESLPSEPQVARLRSELAAYAGCVPQLENEINGLGINWRIDPMHPSTDYFRLSTTTPMSAACAATLAGR
jgi:hypothetical protein